MLNAKLRLAKDLADADLPTIPSTRPRQRRIPRHRGWTEPSQPEADNVWRERRWVRRSKPRIRAITVSATSSARLTSTWTSRESPRSEARAESTARSEEPRQRISCHERSRRCAARGRNASEWRSTAVADSIRASAKRLSGTCSISAMPERHSCSNVVSSMQLSVMTRGTCWLINDVVLLWWAIIAAGDLDDVVVGNDYGRRRTPASISVFFSGEFRKQWSAGFLPQRVVRDPSLPCHFFLCHTGPVTFSFSKTTLINCFISQSSP